MDTEINAVGNAGDDSRKTAILDAAAQLIAERGYHAVRIADIAHLVGTSTGTIHYYFPTKDDVLRAALKYGVGREFERHSKELRTVDSAHSRLLRLIELQLPKLGPMRDDWTIWMQYWAEASIRPELRPMHTEIYDRWYTAVLHIVQRGQSRGEFRTDVDAFAVATELTALIDGLGIHVLTGMPSATLGTMREVLVAYVRDKLTDNSRQVRSAETDPTPSSNEAVP